MLQELADKYKDKGVNGLGVNAEAAYTDDAKKEAQNIRLIVIPCPIEACGSLVK